MNGKVLITGGSRGIGAAIVKLYQEKEYSVLAPTRQELDLASKNSVEQYLKDHRDTDVRILINNAGINHINPIEKIKDDDMEEMLQVNLLSPMALIRGFAEGMKKAHFGRVVNIGSIWGSIAKPGRTGYSMTKGGIHAMTRTLAAELARDGILVNTVSPGQTMTELTKKNNPPEAIEKMKQDIPLGRLAEPEEIAHAVLFLGSEDNTYITGQELLVDGGLTIC